MPKRSNLLQLSLFTLVVFSSAIFRITNLDLIEFKADEAINLFLASRPIFGHPMPPGGTVSSIGILNPPLFNYLLFPLVSVTLDPKLISLTIGAINALSIGFFFLFVKRYYGLIVALVSSLLFAFSPWAILFSRKIWPQNLLIPFSLLFLYSLHKIILEKKQIYWTSLVVSSLFLIQLHQASIFLVVLTTAFLLRQKSSISLRHTLIGFGLGFIPIIPYLLYEINNACPDCQFFLQATRRFIHYSPDIFLRPLQILGQGDFRYILGDDMLTFSQNYPLIHKLRSFFYFEYLLLPLGILIFLKRYRSLRLIGYATVVLPFIYFLLKIEPFMHYFLVILPILFLFLGISFSYFLRHKYKFVKFSSLVLFLSVLVLSIFFNVAFFDLLNNKGGLVGDYRATFKVSEKEAKQYITQYEDRSDYNQIFISTFIPDTLMFGYLPISRMLFPYERTGDRLLALEKVWMERPNDPRIRHEVLAFHTKEPPTKQTVDLLREKAIKDRPYEPLYKLVYQDYLRRSFKKSFVSTNLGFFLDLPEHWTVKESPKGVVLEGDGYTMIIEQSLSGPLTFKKKNYIIKYKPSTYSTLDEITDSIRGLYAREDYSTL